MAVVRRMAVAFGGQTFPGAIAGANVNIHDVHRLEKNAREGTALVSFSIVVDGLGSEATLAAACVALEALFSTRRQALVVTLNGNEALRLDDTDRSGFDVSASIGKPGLTGPDEVFDTNTSRLYEVTVSAGIPADSGIDFRREFSYRVSFSPSRRGQLDVFGTYTAATGGALATANYQGNINARVLTITTGLGGAWELVTEQYTPNDTDTVVEFERTYREVIANQATASLDSPAIVDPSLGITVVTEDDPESVEGTPLLTLRAELSTGVEFTVEPNLLSAWENILLPAITTQLEIFAQGGVAIISAQPRYNIYDHTIDATVVAESLNRGSLLSRTIESVDEVDFGKIIREVWPRDEEVPDDEETENPAPTPAWVGQGPRIITRTLLTTSETVEGGGGDPAGQAPNARQGDELGVGIRAEENQGQAGLATFLSVRTNRRTVTRRKRRGDASIGPQIPVRVREQTEVFRIIVALGGGDAGAGQANGGVGAAQNFGGSGGRA